MALKLATKEPGCRLRSPIGAARSTWQNLCISSSSDLSTGWSVCLEGGSNQRQQIGHLGRSAGRLRGFAL